MQAPSRAGASEAGAFIKRRVHGGRRKQECDYVGMPVLARPAQPLRPYRGVKLGILAKQLHRIFHGIEPTGRRTNQLTSAAPSTYRRMAWNY
jgi:hypothetical protein